jgi:MFS superfamily sulfate permease-like transporter
MLVPVGIAYAQASGVPGIYGLYATIVPLLAYALFGPAASSFWDRIPRSQQSSFASCCRCRGRSGARRGVASAMAVVSGLVCILIGVLRSAS